VITINGKAQTYKQITVKELLVELDLASSVCAIEINNTLVSYNERADRVVQDEDIIEIVSLVGGG
jgi:thiamine biosynthesis protein ThiS